MAAQVLSHRANEVLLLDRDHEVVPLTESAVEAAKVRVPYFLFAAEPLILCIKPSYVV